MTPPSKLATEIVLALDQTLANCYRNPEQYATTVDGKPSSWPDEVRREVAERAAIVECVLGVNGVIQTWSVHCRIISEIDSSTVFEGDLRFQCAENDIPIVVLDYMENVETLWDDRIQPVLAIDYYNSVFAV